MKVKELIKILETCPQDVEVEIRSGYEDHCVSGGAIEQVALVDNGSMVLLVNESDGDALRRLDDYTIMKPEWKNDKL